MGSFELGVHRSPVRRKVIAGRFYLIGDRNVPRRQVECVITIAMDLDLLARMFLRAQEIVREDPNSASAWKRILELSSQRGNAKLTSIDPEAASRNLSQQIERLMNIEPPAEALTF